MAAGVSGSVATRDLIAGVTLAAYAVPVAMAYASLAGLPPQSGIYGYLLGGLLYALFGTSRQLAIGPTSAISLLVGVTVAGWPGDPVRWTSIAALTALLVACMSVLAWALRLSALINFIGETILVGFKAGAALSIAMTQLPKLFGVPGGGEHFFARVWVFASQLGDTHLVVLGCGLAALALLVLGERLLPGRPVPLLLVALALVVMSVSSLGELGVTVVGALPQGLPALRWPSLRPSDVDGILPLAGACFLLAYIEGVSAARTLASKHGYEIDPRQELLALGAANLAAAFGQGFPVTGGLSQSAVNDQAGARTPLALVFASATLALCLLLLTGLLRTSPTWCWRPSCWSPCAGSSISGRAASLACEPFRVQDCHGSAGGRAPAGHPQRRSAGRCGVDPDVDRASLTAACGVPRPHSRHQRFSDLAAIRTMKWCLVWSLSVLKPP